MQHYTSSLILKNIMAMYLIALTLWGLILLFNRATLFGRSAKFPLAKVGGTAKIPLTVPKAGKTTEIPVTEVEGTTEVPVTEVEGTTEVPVTEVGGTTEIPVSVAQERTSNLKSDLPIDRMLPSTCSGRVPCIAFGTTYFWDWNLWKLYLDSWKRSDQAACGNSCDFVANGDSADAVVFHGRDLTPQLPQLKRRQDQRWIYLNMESPIATKKYGYDVSSNPKYRFLFNWTATTSLSSSVFVPYGSWDRVLHPADAPVYSPKAKKFMAFVVFSNCNSVQNNRTAKVAELKKYMEVHVYGECGNRNISRNSSAWQQVSQQYRFYLSFENAFCRDYITEKFHHNGLRYEAVPVVFGGLSRTDYEKVSPPHSFVYALDFSSMRQLADHLTDLAANETRYAEFLDWKRRFKPSRRATILCAICSKLHTDRTTHSVADLKDYYDLEKNCRPVDYEYLT